MIHVMDSSVLLAVAKGELARIFHACSQRRAQRGIGARI